MAFDLFVFDVAYKADHGDLEPLAKLIESGDAGRIALAMGDPYIRELIVKLLRHQPLRGQGERVSVKQGEHRGTMVLQAMLRDIEILHRDIGLPAYSTSAPDNLKTACGKVAKWYGKNPSQVVKAWKTRKR